LNKTNGNDSELQKNIAEFFDNTRKKVKSSGEILNFILSGFKYIDANDRLMFIYMDVISRRKDDEIKLCIFMKKLIEKIKESETEKYIDTKKIKNIISKDITANKELKIEDIHYTPFLSSKDFLNYFNKKFHDNIYKSINDKVFNDFVEQNIEEYIRV
jgi:hypothetical protein